MRRFLPFLLLTLCITALGSPNLCIAVSKRIPTMGDTVRIAAYWDGWTSEAPDAVAMIYAELAGHEKLIGRVKLARDITQPFTPCVEWTPEKDGLWRIIARLEPQPGHTSAIQLPVTIQPTAFAWYGPVRGETEWMTHHLCAPESEINTLHTRGAQALKWAGGVSYFGGSRPEQVQYNIDIEQVGQKIFNDYTNIGRWDGIAVDEIGMWDSHPDQTRLAMAYSEILKKVRAAKPDMTLAIWQFGALNALECNIMRDTTDFILCEVYQNYFRAWGDEHNFYDAIRERVEMARRMGVIKQTMIGLSITPTYGSVTPAEVEDNIRYIRTIAPEMRGVAFFAAGDCDRKTIQAANDACFRYWVRPAVGFFSDADLSLSHSAPQHGGAMKIFATVHNVGGMEARSIALRIWDGDPANGGKLIARRSIGRLPAARWVDSESRDNRSIEPADAMRREGFGMTTVAVPWTATAGPHQIWAEIVPSDNYTVIEGFKSRRFTVREK